MPNENDRLLTKEEREHCRVDWINDKFLTLPAALCSAQDAKTHTLDIQHEEERVERIFKVIEEHSSVETYFSVKGSIPVREVKIIEEEWQALKKKEGVK